MSVGIMGVVFYLVQRLHDSLAFWLLVLALTALIALDSPFQHLLRRRVHHHAGVRALFRQPVRLWGIPVLLMGCGVVLIVYPGSETSVSETGAELSMPDTRCEHPEQSGVLLSVACPDPDIGLTAQVTQMTSVEK